MKATLTGENSFALRQELNTLIDKFINEHGDLAVEQIDAEELDSNKLIQALTSLPFLSDKKLVVLRDPGKNQVIGKTLEEMLDGVPSSTDLIIVETKLDKRLSLYKQLKAKTDFKEFNKQDQFSLARWLVETAKKREAKLTLDNANYLINRLGTNQDMLKNEIDKLILYNLNITKESVDLLTEKSPQSTIFELIEVAFNGNKQKTMKLYKEQREMLVEPQQILAMLSWQLHGIAVVMLAKNKSADVIAKDTKLNPYVIRKNQTMSRVITIKQIKDYIDKLAELDLKLKTKAIDPDEALELYLLNITTR